MTSTAASDTTLQTGQTKNLVLATARLHDHLLGVEHHRAARGALQRVELGLSPRRRRSLSPCPCSSAPWAGSPVGALTDRYGGRVMFTVLTLASAPFRAAGRLRRRSLKSYPLLLVFGFFLGIAGTTFAVGIPFVNAWFEPARRGFATGVFGAGMGGTALSAFFTPRLVRRYRLHPDAPAHRRSPGGRRRRPLVADARTHLPGSPTSHRSYPSWLRPPSCRSPGRCPSSTPSSSVASWPSRPTCRPTSRMSTTST